MTQRRWAAVLAGAMVVAGTTTVGSLTDATSAAPPPQLNKQGGSALGNGLGRLLQQSKTAGLRTAAGGLKINQSALAIRDDAGRVLVQLTPQAGVNRASFRKQAESLGLKVQNTDATSGTLEGFAPLDKVTAMSSLKGTGTIAQSIRPVTHTGSATSQGVALQRADVVQRRGVDGKGITIAALSDSYDQATTFLTGEPLTVHAKDDVRTGDLPGDGNAKYPSPVVVLEDTGPDGGADEGRAMLQIAHDVAPAAKLCFATAFTGEIGFADNIRKLADKKGPCKADVIVDDVSYFSEPMFSDGPIAQAVDDVAAAGVHYFSSSGNSGQRQGWESKVNLVPAAQGLKGTNLDFSGVDPALYDGGLQDMNPGPGTDVAQNLKLGKAGGLFNLQWDDPVDVNGATYGDNIFSATGEITAANPKPSFTFTPDASQIGKNVEFRTDGIPTGTTDLILSVDAPDGTNLGTIDTGSSPEVLVTKLTQAGTYTITVSGFDGATGDFTVGVRPVLSPSKVTTDFNVLLFNPDGSYIGAIADNNPLSGRPQELASLSQIPNIQLVISRAGTGPVGASVLRNILNGDMYFDEYVDPQATTTFGHPTAKGATGVGAYDPFKSYLPEPYTSAGGKLAFYFDNNGNRLAKPDVREKPEVSSTDRGNTTFFVSDDARDPDTQRNFGGTSASAPHAASIAALVLQKAGGPRSYSPRALRAHLEDSTFAHDLDPMFAQGTSDGLTVQARGDQGRENTLEEGSMNDPNFFNVTYTGKVPLKWIEFHGETASPTALSETDPNKSDGIVFDRRPFGSTPNFRNYGFPFTIGGTSGGLKGDKVTPSYSVPGGSQSAPGQFRHFQLNFSNGLKKGQGLSFGVDRDLAVSGFGGSNEGNGADELGGAVFMPSGQVVKQGMEFIAKRADGSFIKGVVVNKLGSGFTAVDGYGMINAEKAVFGGR